MKEGLIKEKEEAVAERDRHWQDVMAQKQQEYQDALSNKVSKLTINNPWKSVEERFGLSAILEEVYQTFRI